MGMNFHPGVFNFESGVLTIKNTIMVSVGAGKNCGGKITDGLGNVQFPGNDCGSTILVGDPQLGQLSNNGGATQTMALSTTTAHFRWEPL